MKKTLLFGALALASQIGVAQTFSDDFEGYNAGEYIGNESTEWSTWSGTTGGNEDAQVVTDNANSGNNAIYFSSSSSTGGPQDVVLDFAGEHNTGGFNYTSSMYVESGKGAYFNLQAETVIGTTWALNVQLDENGVLAVTGPSNNPKLETTFTHDTWFELSIDVNLNSNDWEILIDGVSQGVIQNDLFQVASLDIFPVNASNNQSGFWIDDVSYNLTPYTLPTLNAGITILEANAGLAGVSAKPMVQVRNLGTDALTSFDIAVEYNGTTINQSVTGVNIASLETMDIQLTDALPIIAGTNAMTATVSNPNAGTDMDADDDVKMINVTPVVPADGKVVFVEEATGTWCQWCPRGAVVMGEMTEKYGEFFAGVAVHNGDPMTDSIYDGGMTVAGYPGGYVDRGADIDPLDFEADFLERIVVAPKTSLVNGATWDENTRELKVSVTATFLEAVTGNYRLACVISENDVTGTGSGYNQINAYAGGANGVMGGYELLPSSVPASQMVYDHVARGIAPSYGGMNGGYTTPVAANDSYTMNVVFQLDEGWNEEEMHIVSFMRLLGGRVDNAATVSIDEAVTNGYVLGVEELASYVDGPDARFILYPNPANDITTAAIQVSDRAEVSMTIYNSVGQMIASKNYGEMTGANQLPINTSQLSSGIYTVTVLAGTIQTSQRLIVE